jgi:outer membrane protein OmpA-like peptidoglycan-associated protein/tetratricopeptide (TPR) repeat protein
MNGLNSKLLNMMRKIVLILIVLLTGFSATGIGKTPGDETLSQINKLMSERKFKQAIPLLEQIIAKEPTNSDVNFKLGLCYYFSPDQKNLALEYFRNAMGNINAKYAFNNSKTSNAPVDIYFFLGEAFLNNYMPDSALYYYIKYKNRVKQDSPFDLDMRINWCANSMKEMSTPLNVNIENLGNNINTKYFEKHPVVTLDNSVIFFSSTRPVNGSDANNDNSNEDIYYSIKMPSGNWSKPLYFQFNTPENEFPACLSLDGKMLIFSKEEKDNYDLFYSVFENSQWTKPLPLSGSVNSSANENGASLSKDGNLLYFSSDRNGGFGKYDIYVSQKTTSGKWSTPVNLGKEINTPDNETSPYMHPDGQILYFSSDGYIDENMGGADIFHSTKNSGNTWSHPVHMKYPINTTRNDMDYQIVSGGKRYYTSLTDFNSFDIVEITGQQEASDNVDYGGGTSSLASELNVMEVMEVEKEVEKEVQVTDIVEVQTEVQKEVPVVETVEVEKEPDIKNFSLESVNLEEIDSTARELLIRKVKDYYNEKIGTDKSVIFKTIYFSFNSAELLMLSKNELRVLVEYMKENPTVKVEVIGHTDITGNWDVNLNVSRERAGSVYRFLLESGIAHNRIIYYGKGSADPIASNNTIDGRAKNRRVEILLLK